MEEVSLYVHITNMYTHFLIVTEIKHRFHMTGASVEEIKKAFECCSSFGNLNGFPLSLSLTGGALTNGLHTNHLEDVAEHNNLGDQVMPIVQATERHPPHLSRTPSATLNRVAHTPPRSLSCANLVQVSRPSLISTDKQAQSNSDGKEPPGSPPHLSKKKSNPKLENQLQKTLEALSDSKYAKKNGGRAT